MIAAEGRGACFWEHIESWPRLAGRCKYRAPCPRLIGFCLDLASPIRGRILAAFTAACLQTHLASRQEKRVIIIILI